MIIIKSLTWPFLRATYLNPLVRGAPFSRFAKNGPDDPAAAVSNKTPTFRNAFILLNEGYVVVRQQTSIGSPDLGGRSCLREKAFCM